jgi:signal transduction histidine kinase
MRERMQGVMGQFEISGEPGKGTTVIIRVPLNEAQAEAV